MLCFQNIIVQAAARPSSYIWLSCLVFWCCNPIAGGIAFALSCKLDDVVYSDSLLYVFYSGGFRRGVQTVGLIQYCRNGELKERRQIKILPNFSKVDLQPIRACSCNIKQPIIIAFCFTHSSRLTPVYAPGVRPKIIPPKSYIIVKNTLVLWSTWLITTNQ